MNAAQLVDRIVEGDYDIDPSELARLVPGNGKVVPAKMFFRIGGTNTEREVNFAYVLNHWHSVRADATIMLKGMKDGRQKVMSTDRRRMVLYDDENILTLWITNKADMRNATNMVDADTHFIRAMGSADALIFNVDAAAATRWLENRIGESEEPEPSELASQLPDAELRVPASMRTGGHHHQMDVNFGYVLKHNYRFAIGIAGMLTSNCSYANFVGHNSVDNDTSRHYLVVRMSYKDSMVKAARVCGAPDSFLSYLNQAPYLEFLVDREALLRWFKHNGYIGQPDERSFPIGESDIDPSELVNAVPDSKWRLTRSETDKQGRRWMEYQHTCGVSFELKNVYYGTPTFGRSMLKVWNINVYDPDGQYIDGATNIKASTVLKAFEEGKTWTAKLLRDYSRGFYRAVIAESDDPLDPSVLAASLPDYVNGILRVDDVDDPDDGTQPEPVRVNAVFYLQTKSHRWLKQMRHHASYGGSPSVTFEVDPAQAQTWTYAALMRAPESFVEYVKRMNCAITLEMDKDRMLDWIAAWLAKPQL